MKTVYIIECSSGSWDSYHWWIGGIYTDQKKAEQAKDKLNSDAKAIQDNCPVNTREDGITDYDSLDLLSEEDQNNYWNYFSKYNNVILDEVEVAKITLVSLHGNNEKMNLMQKYFGHEEFEKSWWAYSHDTYLDCYLTIYNEFSLPKIADGFHAGSFTSIDSKGIEFKYSLSCGFPSNESDEYLASRYNADYYFDNGVSFQIDKNINGLLLGEEINKNIKMRTRDTQIKEILQ